MAYYPEPATPDALPLSNVDERMLRAGGHFEPRTDLYLSKGRRPGSPAWQQGIPRNPKRGKEFYPGEFFPDEPDPNVSNSRTTGRLIKRMVQKQWNREQILNALTDDHNRGGLWFCWHKDHEDLLDRWIEGTAYAQRNPPITAVVNPPITSDQKPPNTSSEGSSTDPGRAGPGFVIVPAIVDRFLAYAEQEPRSRTDMIERSRIIRHKGAAGRYVDHLTEHGLVEWVTGPRTKPRGPVPLYAHVTRPKEDLAALMSEWLR